MKKILHRKGRLTKGKFKIIDGVILSFDPDDYPEKPLIAGIPEKYAKDIASALDEMEKPKLSAKKLKAAMELVSTTLAKYYGKHLPTTKKSQLQKLYAGAINVSFNVNKELSEKKITVNKAQKKLAKAIGDMVLDEMKIFVGHRKAQLTRYRKWRGKHVPDNTVIRDLLSKAFDEFLTGKYLKNDAKIIKQEQKLLQYPDSTKARKMLSEAIFRFDAKYAREMSFNMFEPGRDILYEYRYTMHPREYTGWEVHIFTAEHSILSDSIEKALEAATGFLWSDISSDVGLVHVSVVVGLYKQYKQRILREKIGVTTGEVKKEDRYTIWGSEFDDWIVVNGSASWVRSDDELIRRHAVYKSTREYALRYAKGATKKADGRCFPVRACAYSVGMYGINWVCHQNSNAFARRKWNIYLVNYPTTYLFGLDGNFWAPIIESVHVSERKCPVWGVAPIRGGIPGDFLYYHVVPPYVLPYHLTVDAIMDSSGYGLDTFWHPGGPKKTKGWYPTYAHYRKRARYEIPFAGIDNVWNTVNFWS